MTKKKKTPEELQQDFQNFKESEIGLLWQDLANEARNFEKEPELSTVDIFEDWRPFLVKMKELMNKFKIKSKEKYFDQNIIRSFFFEKPNLGPNQQNFVIDGVMYEMTNGSKSAFWNSKGLMLDLIRRAKEINEKNSSIDENNYLAEKKAFMVELKKFDKDYIKHKKNVHPEIDGFIQTAFIPLVNVLESNMEFHKLEKLIKNGAEVPDF